MNRIGVSVTGLEAMSVELARKRHTRHIKHVELSGRAFGYARYSDDGQDPISIDRQVQSILQTNRECGLPAPKIFIDEARTGQDNERAGARELIAELGLKENYGATLTFESGDRLFRSLLAYAEIQTCCAKNGIRLYTRKGPLEAEHLPLEAMFALMEITKMQHRFSYKKKQNRLAGLSSSYTPWGFLKVDGKNVPHPDLIEHVVDMFQMAASGMKPGEIARVFTAKGIKPPRASLWHPSTIANILTNPVYDGRTILWGDKDTAE